MIINSFEKSNIHLKLLAFSWNQWFFEIFETTRIGNSLIWFFF
jgi:hypothetical protein